MLRSERGGIPFKERSAFRGLAVNITRKDLVLLSLAATMGAVIGTIAVGIVAIQLTKSSNPKLATVRNWLVAGINGVENETASL